MIVKKAVVAALAIGVAACAKSPESIAPAYVSQNNYAGYNCPALSEERSRVAAALSQASQQQSDARTNDVVGVILIGLPVSTLSGGNVAHQVADLKGQLTAIDQTLIKKRCSKSIASSPTVSSTSSALSTGAASDQIAASQPETVAVSQTRSSGVQPLPVGPNVAKPVAYSSEEILEYCRQGWDTRTLTDGKIEYNPCFYQ